jgi:hypothetical protein
MQQDGAHFGVGIRARQRFGELRVHLRSDRVLLLEAIEADAGDALIGLTSNQGGSP